MNIDYDEYMRSLTCLIYQIEKSNFQPDIVVGVCRGGLIPAVSLSHALNAPMRALHWSMRDWEAREYLADIAMNVSVNNLKVLLVDEIIDGGTTIEEIKKDWDVTDNENVKVACIVYNIGQTIAVPDFWYKTIDRSVDQSWISFWWELDRGTQNES